MRPSQGKPVESTPAGTVGAIGACGAAGAAGAAGVPTGADAGITATLLVPDVEASMSPMVNRWSTASWISSALSVVGSKEMETCM